MNIHQQTSSHQFIQPQNTESVGGVSDSIDYIQEQGLKSYLYKKNGKNVLCFVSKENLIEYAFDIGKQITAVNKFELGTLRAKWLGEKSNSDFLLKTIKDSKNISKLNNKINDYIINQSKQIDVNLTKNPDFPDGTFIYKNQYGKEFKVLTLGGKAINITCDNNYITGHQKGAIQRAINENRVEKFEEFMPNKTSQVKVIKDNTLQQIQKINNKNVYNVSNFLEKETANSADIEKTVVHTVYKCERLLTDELSQYTQSLKIINRNLFAYNTHTDLNNEILQQLCIGLFIFSKKAGFPINQLKDVVNNPILFENYKNSFLKNIEINNFSYDFMRDILSFLTKAEQIIIDSKSIETSAYNFSDIGDDIFTNGFEEEKNPKDISQQDAWNTFTQGHRANNKATYTGQSNNTNI